MRRLVNGAALNLVDEGEGPPALLFLHYFGGSARSWFPLCDHLRDRYRCIMPDLRGFGSSDDVPDRHMTKAAADDIAALIEMLALRDVVLVGHSMGGKIAMALAARRLPEVDGLVLIAPSPPTPEPITDGDRADLLAAYGDPEKANATAQRLTIHPPTAPLFRQVVEDSLRTTQAAWTSWLETGSREDISVAMERIDVPALVVIGGDDETIPRATIEREVSGRLQAAETVVIPGAKHLVPLGQPVALAEAVETWLVDRPNAAARPAPSTRVRAGRPIA